MTKLRRLAFETLEPRHLLAADLTVVDVQFVDPTDIFGAATGVTPVEGQKIALRAETNFSDLTGADFYNLRFEVDGVAVDVENIQGVAGQNVTFFWERNGWFARPGVLHTVTVTIDPDNTVAEVDELNNTFSFQFTPDAPTSLPQKFINPVAGDENVDWIVNGYVDVDPEICFDCAEDFRGNTAITRDGHSGLDLGLIDFEQADRGVEVRAAADGTVILVQDGNFDRWSSFQFPIPQGNRVFIDHGNGWVTQYYHMQRDSVAVNVGDPVTAGDVIGMVGSSGNSAGPHLHFEVQRNHLPVEPSFSPADYFVDPAAYAYDVDPVLHDVGVTTAFPYFRDVIEQPSDNDALPASAASLFPWVIFSSIEPGDTWELKLFEPDGTEFVQPGFAVPIEFPADISGSWQWNRWWNVFLSSPDAGNWRAKIFVNGTSVGEEFFVVGRSLPELRVIEDVDNSGDIQFDEPLIIDGRRTPLDFGGVAIGGVSPTKQFIVENHGAADLTISSVQLPVGYSLAEPLDTTITAGSSDTFTIALDTAVGGVKSGTIQIVSNDRAASDFDDDGDIDGANFLQWQRGFGIANGAATTDGDGNGTGAVGADDLTIWQQQFGSATETVFEFNLEGVVSLPIAVATSGILPFDEALLGTFAEDDIDQVFFEQAQSEPAVVPRIAEEGSLADDPSGTATDPTRGRELRGESEPDESLADALFDQLGGSS